VLRALSVADGHFLLGAAHSLGNLGLRIGLLDPQAGPAIQAARPKADFAPGSDDKRAWLPLSVSSEILAKAASGSANTPLARISAAVSGLAADPRYVALDSRRGMDHHRLRPQSVPHASPKRGVSQAGDGERATDQLLDLLERASHAVRCMLDSALNVKPCTNPYSRDPRSRARNLQPGTRDQFPRTFPFRNFNIIRCT
jgi:hypothetical protein